MKEVELKARLREPEAVLARLQGLGCSFGKRVLQDDAVYVRETGSVEKYLTNADYLRLRVEDDGTTLLTLKHHAGRADDPHDAPTEHETKVESRQEVARMLEVLGFHEAVRIQKARRKGKYGAWEVCFDEVENLGAFLELEEMLPEDANVPAVMGRMKEFLISLGVPEEDIGVSRYDTLMLERDES